MLPLIPLTPLALVLLVPLLVLLDGCFLACHLGVVKKALSSVSGLTDFSNILDVVKLPHILALWNKLNTQNHHDKRKVGVCADGSKNPCMH